MCSFVFGLYSGVTTPSYSLYSQSYSGSPIASHTKTPQASTKVTRRVSVAVQRLASATHTTAPVGTLRAALAPAPRPPPAAGHATADGTPPTDIVSRRAGDWGADLRSEISRLLQPRTPGLWWGWCVHPRGIECIHIYNRTHWIHSMRAVAGLRRLPLGRRRGLSLASSGRSCYLEPSSPSSSSSSLR